jgi:hypothetical protein
MTEDDYVVVASYNFRHEADLVKTYLSSEGIEIFESSDDCGGADPGLGFGTRTRVLVPASQAERAIALLKKAGKRA